MPVHIFFPRWRSFSARHLAAGLFLLTAPVMAAGSANAGVKIEGSARAVRIDVTKASITEVLSALGQTFQVRYRSEVPLDREIDGTYHASA